MTQGILGFHLKIHNLHLLPHQDIVDRNVHKLDYKTNEAHDQESNSGSLGNIGEFFSILGRRKMKCHYIIEEGFFVHTKPHL